MKFLAWGMLILLAALASVSCRQLGPPPEPIDLVPVNANLVGLVQVAQFQENPVTQRVWEAVQQSGPYAAVRVRPRLAIRETLPEEQTLLFAEITEITSPRGYWAVIFEEPGGRADLISRMEDQPESRLTERYYSEVGSHKFTMFAAVMDDNPIGISFLEPDITIIGSQRAVSDVHAVFQGKGDSLSGPGLEALESSEGSLVSLSLVPDARVLPQLQGNISEFALGGFFQDGEVFQDVEVLTLTVDPAGQGFNVEAGVHFTGSEPAEDFSKTFNGLLNLAAGFTPDQDLKELVGKLDVAVDGDLVTVRLPLDEAELVNLLGVMTSN